MKRISLILAMLIIGVSSLSAKKINIKGTIKDSTNKENLPYCEVLLKTPKDSLLTGCITNDKGEYSLFAELKGDETMYVRMFGYMQETIKLSNIDSTATVKYQEVFLKQATKELKALEIVTLRPFVEKKFDRDVFNMSEGAVASARNIFDLLKKIPGVVVDEENNIVKYKGNTATVKINNTPADRIYPKLEMVPIADVDKIEVIDPTMRGKGNGSSGAIINIKIKKVVLDGMSGSAGGRVNINDSLALNGYNAYSNVNYKHKKYLIYNNLGIYNHQWTSNSKSTGTFSNEFGNFSDSSKSNYIGIWESMYEYVGAEYSFSDKTKMGIQVGTNFGTRNTNDGSSFENIMNTTTNSIVDRSSNVSSSRRLKGNNNLGVGLSFSSEIDTLGKELTIDFWGNKQASRSISNDFTDYLYSPDLTEIQKKNNNYSSSYLEIFYNNPISKNTQWNIGYSGNTSTNTANCDFMRNNTYMYPLFEDSKTHNYENTLSAHFGTTLKKKIKVNGGISFQNQIMGGNRTFHASSISDTLISINKIYNKLLPSATIKYDINDKNELKLSYDCNTQMPYSIRMLETIIDSSNIRAWSTGNPDIKPAFFQSIYLGYTYTKEKWNTSIQAFYKTTHNNFTYVSIPLDSLRRLSKPLNLEENQSVGFFYSLYQTFANTYTISFNTNWFYSKVDLTAIKPYLLLSGVPADNLIRNSWNYDMSANFEYRKNKNYASLSAYYNSKQISTTGFDMPKFDMNVSYSRSFLKNNLRVALGFNNILFGIIKPVSVTNVMGKNLRTESYNNYSRRAVSISIRYNFREGDRNTASKQGRGK